LQNRVDLDNVHRLIATSREFQNVRSGGYAKSHFKENPWQHMNPFMTKFSWKGSEFTCGITDHEHSKPSACGARVYVQGPIQILSDCFNMVLRLIPQQDLELSEHNVAYCKLRDGRIIKWAAMTDDEVWKELGLPDFFTWKRWTTEVKCEADFTLAVTG
jgi:hypothetical protein